MTGMPLAIFSSHGGSALDVEAPVLGRDDSPGFAVLQEMSQGAVPRRRSLEFPPFPFCTCRALAGEDLGLEGGVEEKVQNGASRTD